MSEVATWTEAATRLGGRFRSQGKYFRIEVPMPPTTAILDRSYMETGWRTRARVPFFEGAPRNFSVAQQGVLAGLLKPLGFIEDIEIGHERFDRIFVVKGFPAERVRELLAPPLPELLLSAIQLKVWTVDPLFLSGSLPEGVRFIEVVTTAPVVRAETLVTMGRILETLLERIDPVGTDPEEGETDVRSLIARVQRAGGIFSDPWTIGTQWNLDPPRLEAIQELGTRGDPAAVPALIGVLGGEDADHAAAAIVSLVELDDPRCIPALIRELGRREKAEGRTLTEHAARALRHFDRAELADAFVRTLEGREAPLQDHMGPYRTEVIDALMLTGASFDLEARVHAVRALGRLGAREALPLLRDASKSMGIRTKYSEAAREAIREIESQASLPRPAAAAEAETPDTLPRPATSGETTPEGLPRPADPQD